MIRAGYESSFKYFWFKISFLILPYPLTNFEIQKYYQNEPRFNAVYYGDNLPKKIKDGTL